MSSIRDYIAEKKHHAFRKTLPEDYFCRRYSQEGLSDVERMTRRMEEMCALETPVILPGEKITMMRTVACLPDCFTKEEWDEIKKKHFVHELGYNSNLCCDFAPVIENGLLWLKERSDDYGKRSIDALLSLCDRYCEQAKNQGREDLAKVLARVPRYGATCFHEALQSFRALHYALWLEGNYHNTCGRADQYLFPYLQKDLENQTLTRESALELLEDFFVSFNKDSDHYPGIQQGDNGQSMMLGGVDEEGKDAFNLLSQLCLEASCNNKMIDPKINLRVHKNTPTEVYEMGSRLTKAGLGFPQYSNDDVVIPGLLAKGYSLEDARNYTVAACWEFIIPKYGADIANIGALSFPLAVDRALHQEKAPESFEGFFEKVKEEIRGEVESITQRITPPYFVPSPFQRLMLEPKYHNFGIHGTGIATAADSLSAIYKHVYQEKTLSLKELKEAVDDNFASSAQLLHRLRFDTPKMGQNDERADGFATELLDAFADALAPKTNCLGGCYRAGTGTAMYYLWHADQIGASPDGRRRGEPFGTNFSPSLFAHIGGPLSVIASFTKQNFTKAINGGPLTLEFSSSMFDTEESIRKIALLVRSFVLSGGHQLQLNAVNAEALKDAQLHPEKYRQLIVRIWGWSAYFVELDKAFQDHVIQRREYRI